jgi:mannose-6-phosphate isomerase-like protein (cupin superfamily)
VLHRDERDVEGVRAPAPHSRTLKHMVAPWTGGSEAMWVGFSIIDEHSSSNPHHHSNEEIFIVVEGSGRVIVDGEQAPISPGSVVRVAPGQQHQLVNEGEGVLKVACAASPAFGLADFGLAHNLPDTADRRILGSSQSISRGI